MVEVPLLCLPQDRLGLWLVLAFILGVFVCIMIMPRGGK